ncbi:MAG: UxaA family hydrolase [Actinobacteria bacterium]|nr:UxaA family hydrolase [Actinomycetota bacterium]
MGTDAIICHPDDTVATAVRDLAPGERVRATGCGEVVGIELRDSVLLGHKLALRDICEGEEIIKYGEKIGRATSAIRQGEHVHLHNVDGLRGRGDLR